MVGFGKKSLFGGKKNDVKAGESWSDVSDDRKYRQHPHGISDTDAHSIPKHTSPVYRAEANQVETDAAIDELKQKVQALRGTPPEQRVDEQLIDDDALDEDRSDRYHDDWTD